MEYILPHGFCNIIPPNLGSNGRKLVPCYEGKEVFFFSDEVGSRLDLVLTETCALPQLRQNLLLLWYHGVRSWWEQGWEVIRSSAIAIHHHKGF